LADIAGDPVMSEPSKLSFEESIQRLSKIVEGIKLTRQSQARLDAAERRIEELLEVNDEGEPMTRPMSLRES
jgi:exonuclease VII small subunit